MFSAAEIAPVTTMGSAMFFGTATFAAVALTVRCKLCGDGGRAWAAAHNPRSTALDVKSFTSIYILLFHTTVMGLILFYAYLCEYHPPFPHSQKSYDRDEFFFLTFLLIFVSLFTMKSAHKPGKDPQHKDSEISDGGAIESNGAPRAVAPVDDKTEVLNRDQTEEWKGWMQFMFLLYHYYHAEEVYNAIRIMITCYVWMTGFGNFSFFYIKGDYGLIRVLQMLWRLNFLVIFLCLTQGTTYILYYICLLHTYFFMMVYVTMRIYKSVNYTKWGIRLKMLVLALLIFLVWDVDTGIFQVVHWPFLGTQPMLGATSGAMWEWYFRSSLDHWSTYLGMVFALNFPITSLFFRKLEAQPLARHIAAKSAMGIAFLAAFYWWVMNPFQHEKYDYNQTNAYFGCIPLLAYIYFRNLTPWLRSHTLDLLHQIGKTTLETYLMQHHIWLTSNAKSLLTIIPGWPKVNFLLVSIIYVLASRRLYSLTLFLRGMILPNDLAACLRNLFYMILSLVSFVGIAYMLQFLGILTLPVVGVFSMFFGAVLYEIIVQATWPSYSDTIPNANARNGNSTSMAPAAGSLIVVLLGIAWHQMALNGAGKIIPLPATCEPYVQKGAWVPIDACNENTRGEAFRDYNLASLASCSLSVDPAYVWGWESVPSSTHCRFAYRDKKTLLKALKHRKITFIGDSILRHLYYATCRQLGDAGAGAYNTTIEKHSDFSKKYGSTELEFRWAPYTTDISKTADELLDEKSKPDIVIAGGGAWDRLHLYGTSAEQNTLHDEIGKMTQKLGKLNSYLPVTWVVPSTINSWALASEEKRSNIREEQIEALRHVYEDKGLYEKVSFVLDGRSFTSDRVTESYDGVHYPVSVYDAGAQILANAFDWLLPESQYKDSFTPPKPGIMDNYWLGLLMLTFVTIGVLGFDGFMGMSYFAGFFVPSVMPANLFNEAFTSLHSRLGLPPLDGTSPTRTDDDHSSSKGKYSEKSLDDDESEMHPLKEATV